MPALKKLGSETKSAKSAVSTIEGKPPSPRTRLAIIFPAAWKARRDMGIRSVQGKPGSADSVVVRDGVNSEPGKPEELPRYTNTPAMTMKIAWSAKDAARTQRLRSPNLRWKEAVATEPSRKAKTDTTDFVQARRGDETGRSETPRAAKTVLPV
jgi:hypothetical protein